MFVRWWHAARRSLVFCRCHVIIIVAFAITLFAAAAGGVRLPLVRMGVLLASLCDQPSALAPVLCCILLVVARLAIPRHYDDDHD